MSSAYIEIDRALLATAALAGLVEFRDDHWTSTELGNRVVLDYCDKLLNEGEGVECRGGMP